MSGDRIKWIDVAKGLGLVLVVIGHFCYGGKLSIVNKAIYSFHMPMFFMLSGLTSTMGTKRGFGETVRKKAKRLLLPSVLFVAMTIPVYVYANRSATVLQALRELSFFDGQIPYNSPCWFLIVLFEVELLGYFLDGRSVWVRLAVAVLAFVGGKLLYVGGVTLVFGLNKAVIALLFYLVGTLLAPWLTSGKAKRTKWAFLFLAVWVAAGLIGNGKVTMYEMELGHYELFALSGIAGSVLFLLLCQLLRESDILARIGNNTVFIMGTHVLCSFAFKKGMALLHLTGTWLYTLLAALAAIGLVLAYLPLCKWVDRYAPVLSGKQ